MRPTILLDCDGPLSNFTQAFLDALYLETGARHTPDEVDRYHIHKTPFFARVAEQIVDTRANSAEQAVAALKSRCIKHVVKPGFCEAIQVQPGATDAVERLQQLGEVFVVTSPWDSPTWQYERARWLRLHFGIDRDHLLSTSAKHLVFGDMLVEDKSSHALEWARRWSKSRAFLFDMHHNRSGGDLISSSEAPTIFVHRGTWSTIIAYAETLK